MSQAKISVNLLFCLEHQKQYNIGTEFWRHVLRKSINDNGKQKATSFPVKILTVENRDVESKSGSLFEATFTMSFPDDVDEKYNSKEKRNRISKN